MKKITILTLIVACVYVTMLSSCSSSKKIKYSTTEATMTKDVMTETEEYAMKSPSTRFATSFEHPKRQFAISYATTMARDEIARRMASAISSAITISDNTHDQATTTLEDTKSVMDADGVYKTHIEDAAKAIVRDFPVLKYETFTMKNGSTRAYVCVGYSEDIAKITEKIHERLKRAISEEEKLKMDFDRQKFMEEFKKQMDNFEQMRNAGY